MSSSAGSRPRSLERNAMYPVYGLAEASLAVSFPRLGAPLRTITLNRHRMNPGNPVELVDAAGRERGATGLRRTGHPLLPRAHRGR